MDPDEGSPRGARDEAWTGRRNRNDIFAWHQREVAGQRGVGCGRDVKVIPECGRSRAAGRRDAGERSTGEDRRVACASAGRGEYTREALFEQIPRGARRGDRIDGLRERRGIDALRPLPRRVLRQSDAAITRGGSEELSLRWNDPSDVAARGRRRILD